MPIRDEQKAATRARLLDAAATLIAARGVDRASIDAIAAEAGVTSGAVYASFRGKSDLLLALARERGSRVGAGTVGTLAGSIGRQVSEYAGSPVDGALFAALLSAASRDPELREALAEGISTGTAEVAERLRAEGRPLALPAEQAALLVQVLVAGLLAVKPVLGDDLPDDLLASAAALLFRDGPR